MYCTGYSRCSMNIVYISRVTECSHLSHKCEVFIVFLSKRQWIFYLLHVLSWYRSHLSVSICQMWADKLPVPGTWRALVTLYFVISQQTYTKQSGPSQRLWINRHTFYAAVKAKDHNSCSAGAWNMSLVYNTPFFISNSKEVNMLFINFSVKINKGP